MCFDVITIHRCGHAYDIDEVALCRERDIMREHDDGSAKDKKYWHRSSKREFVIKRMNGYCHPCNDSRPEEDQVHGKEYLLTECPFPKEYVRELGRPPSGPGKRVDIALHKLRCLWDHLTKEFMDNYELENRYMPWHWPRGMASI